MKETHLTGIVAEHIDAINAGDTDRTVATFAAHRPTNVINLRLSRQLLAPHLANLDDLVARLRA